MKLRFLMSHHRKNSVRDKVMGKKWIYLERSALHSQTVGHLRRWERHQDMGLSVFIGLGNFIGWVGGLFHLFQEGAGISRNWATTHFLILMVDFGTVMAPVGVSFSLLICHSERILRSSGSWLVRHLGPIWFYSVFVMSSGYVILSEAVPCPIPSCFKSTPAILYTPRLANTGKRERILVQL